MRDPDDECAPVDDRIPVHPLGRNVELDRNAGPLLDDVAAYHARVVGRPACHEDDALELFDVLAGHVEALEDERAVPDAVADRLGDGIGLLVDLLQHERLVARLLGALVVPVELDGLVLGRAAVDVDVYRPRRSDGHDLAVPRELHHPRLAQEGGGIRREERLVLADPDDERHLVPSADEEPGVVAMDDDEREVTLELGEGQSNRFGQIAVVMAFDEVGDGLCVCLGGQRVTFRSQALAQLAVVLDDAVQHDRHLPASQPTRGWAFCSVTAPCVAQRV